ncbi:hypothetical protein [Nocardia sp. NPDC058666]|uniref:hypothetical protein n=1 Tax=Nocardia sp. NPDC058666 TaxID=3346587 RepID=UPI00364727A6
MTRTHTATARKALGATAIIAGLAAVVAPPATASVTTISIAPSATFGLHPYGTGCSYTVNVTVDDNTKTVYFYEEGQGPSGFSEAVPVNGVASTTWVPSRTDITYIYAFQPGATSQTRFPVSVGTGIDTGSACIAF